MSDNIVSVPEFRIPSREEEHPVQIFAGKRLKNPALHCRPEHLWPSDIKTAPIEWIHSMEIYLANFCKPNRTIADELKCTGCNTQVTGHHVLLADWRHKDAISFDPKGAREGKCNHCGYPCRLDHKIHSLESGKLLVHLKNFPLFYHPSATIRMMRK